MPTRVPTLGTLAERIAVGLDLGGREGVSLTSGLRARKPASQQERGLRSSPHAGRGGRFIAPDRLWTAALHRKPLVERPSHGCRICCRPRKPRRTTQMQLLQRVNSLKLRYLPLTHPL